LNFMEKLIRALQDDYKVGVEASAKSPIVYINPDALDRWSADRVLNLKQSQILTRQDEMAKKILSDQIRQQLDEQIPGISQKFSPRDIEGLYNQSLVTGPFADQTKKESLGITIINMPKSNQVDKDKILETFGILKTASDDHKDYSDPNDPYDGWSDDDLPHKHFDSNHIKPLPGESSTWRELVGQHEGEHVNQDLRGKPGDERHKKVLGFEGGADRVAIAHLQTQGQHEVAQAFIDIRALSAIEGDVTHATGPLITKGHDEAATDQHVAAAKSAKKQMLAGVSEELGISILQAEDLRKTDPQKFVRALDAGLEAGRIPLPEEINSGKKWDAIRDAMGVTPDEFNKYGIDKVPETLKVHDRLKQEGAFRSKEEPNPHVKEYMEQYSGAVKRLFIEDTTPKPGADKKETPTPSAPKRSTEEVIANLTDAQMKEAASSQSMEAIDSAVAKRLGITQIEAGNMRYDGIEAQKKYIALSEEVLNAGEVKTSQHRTKTETEELLKKTLNVSDDEFAVMKHADKFRIDIAYDGLLKSGDLFVEYNNPHMEIEARGDIELQRMYLQRKINAEELKAKDTAKDLTEEEPTPEEEPAPDEESAMPDAHSAPASTSAPTSGTYDYLRSKEQDTGNGTPKVDLNGDDGAKMRMGSLMPREYFALQADPVLAQQQLTAKQAQAQQPEPEQRPAPAARQPDALRI